MKDEFLVFMIIILLVPISGCLEKGDNKPKVYIVFFDEDVVLMDNESENKTGSLRGDRPILNKTYSLNITQLNITTIIVELIHNNMSYFDRYGTSTYPFEHGMNITLTVTPPKNASITCSPSNPASVIGPNHFLVDTYVTRLEMNISLRQFPEKREIDEDGYDEAILQETDTDAIGEWGFFFEFYLDGPLPNDPSGGGPVKLFLAWDLTMTAHHYHSMMRKEV